MMRGQKSWKKNQTSTTQIFLNLSKKNGKLSIKSKSGLTEYLRGLNPFIDVKMPTWAINLYNSSTARTLNAWRGMKTLPELRVQ